MQENKTIVEEHKAILQRQGQMLMNLMQGFQQLARDTNQNLEQLQIWMAATPTAEASKTGDHVLIDYAGVLLKEDGSMEELSPGVPALFQGGNGEMFVLTQLGSGKMISGFEEALIGRKSGEELEAVVQFPEQYAEHLKGRKAKFFLHIHEVRSQYPTSVVGELIRQHARLQGELQAKAAAEAAEKAKTAEQTTAPEETSTLEDAIANRQAAEDQTP
jgi:FKBP-type peptidyl-prolyl cis-trans isomerase (trigger factor)